RKDTGVPLNINEVDILKGGKGSSLIVWPPALLVPGVTYTIGLDVFTGVPGLSGSAHVDLTMPRASPIAIISNSSNIVTEELLTLFAGHSCDPNLVSPRCVSGVGAVAAVSEGINGL